MKILFVCQQYIHSARWINQLKDSHHEIFLFDCLDRPIHKDLKWTNYYENWGKRKIPYIKGEHFLKKKFPNFYAKIEYFLKVTPSEKLCQIIKEIQPDLVHSLEMQSQTYNIVRARKKYNFKWAYFCWGNDLFAYYNKARHKKVIVSILNKIDFLFTDTTRDIVLANALGYSNSFSKVFPGGGGYNLEYYRSYIKTINNRTLILIKGYEHNYGRALNVLNALTSIIDKVKEYNIYVYSAHEIVVDKIKEINKNTSLNIEYSLRSDELSHQALLQKFSDAVIAIGNSISDGIPNTLLEAMICGAFPIQSNPGGATEDYIKDGENGLLIHNPESEAEISEKIKQALSNKTLIENAFTINQEIAKNRLEYNLIKSEVLEVYKQIEDSL